MRYALFLNYPEAQDAGISDDDIQQGQAAFTAYVEALDSAGVLLTVDILQPVAASTTVSTRGGTLSVQDGPFIDTRERVGGVFVIDVADLDAAIAWAEKSPATGWGAVEIRPTALTWDRSGGWH